ncbi:M17 family metallopeptidase [Carboxylicivirga sp. M1479]|uniref:leucyl aminopeptidase family protein n=1 Tax=Carboxylicivirga sp. M1479 TaxID=2594476 RepID=UPI001177EA65|nr:leucyl aminopeptidase [Carboxylicivirga sp. M1479]TRX64592.1 leucyl aminopeptidase [Carboxylicivirga sp. M1479]
MQLQIKHTGERPENVRNIFLVKNAAILKDFGFNSEALAYVENKIEAKEKLITIQNYNIVYYVRIVADDEDNNKGYEALRKDGSTIYAGLKSDKQSSVCIYDLLGDKAATLALTEGLALSAYRFDKYKTDKTDEAETVTIWVASSELNQGDLDEVRLLSNAVYVTRNLVNEPVSTLNVEELSDTISELGAIHGFDVEIFDKAKIEALKFGGLLGVNKGSVDPPAFHILEWKPENASNEQPVVLVGKGVVFDTGGINLKTPPGSLDDMKADMGGAASVVGAFVAIASNKLPVHVVGLIPATDNRPGGNAIVPGDVLTMHNGKTVEVLNTDAEGRLIMADALSYAKKYDPELVIDLATLTGSAVMALGQYATVGMGTANDSVFKQLEEAGNRVYERVVRFPFWDEYGELIKSDIADIKNLGIREAGAITAGKFLSHFVEAPWIHLDIAGPAYVKKPDSYRGSGGTGVGVRMLYEFLKNRS